jgi:hypothetical protein
MLSQEIIQVFRSNPVDVKYFRIPQDYTVMFLYRILLIRFPVPKL